VIVKGRSPGDQSLSCFRSTHDRFAADMIRRLSA
jgi:uncharacterized protein YhfF